MVAVVTLVNSDTSDLVKWVLRTGDWRWQSSRAVWGISAVLAPLDINTNESHGWPGLAKLKGPDGKNKTGTKIFKVQTGIKKTHGQSNILWKWDKEATPSAQAHCGSRRVRASGLNMAFYTCRPEASHLLNLLNIQGADMHQDNIWSIQYGTRRLRLLRHIVAPDGGDGTCK